ncbi:MAG: hypothetical protein J5J06_12750 [Phycisphaerae bacterium]|nr:hypothetical protein [Phycisphaerae bacterium]
MSVELYSTTKAAIPWRTFAGAILLLAATTLLALQLSLSRRADPLSFAISPPGWNASFRVPRGFEHTAPFRTTSAEIIRFTRPFEGSGEANLLVWKILEDPPLSPRDTARQIILFNSVMQGGLTGSKEMIEAERPIGSAGGIELLGGAGRTVVRVANLRNGGGFAVSLAVDQGPIPDELYDLFDELCRSFEFSQGTNRQGRILNSQNR